MSVLDDSTTRPDSSRKGKECDDEGSFPLPLLKRVRHRNKLASTGFPNPYCLSTIRHRMDKRESSSSINSEWEDAVEDTGFIVDPFYDDDEDKGKCDEPIND